MNDPWLYPWAITEKDGKVLTAHCNCMAGLGETCSHVGALLFAVEATVKIRESRTVTQEKAYWLLPTGSQTIEYKPVKEIDFRSSRTLKRHLDTTITCGMTPKTPDRRQLPAVPETTSEDLQALFRDLHETGKRPAVLSIIPTFAHEYIPTPVTDKFPMILSELRDEKCLTMDKHDLIVHCESVFSNIKVDQRQADNVEMATRAQSKSKEWFRFRSGRITASRFKAACKTSVEKPSQSLIRAICYPESTKFTSVATTWGCQHERVAKDRYNLEMKTVHENFEFRSSGLVIHPDHPFIGATPDGVVSCDCCGEGCVEIKCPYCHRHKKLGEHGGNSCLEKVGDRLQLKKTHEYYYQVQCQIFVCKKDFCDFVVWTEVDYHYERIEPDVEFWSEALEHARVIFMTAVLPELVGKFISRPTQISTNTDSLAEQPQTAVPCVLQPVRTPAEPSSSGILSPKQTNSAETESNDTSEGDSDKPICVCQKPYDENFDSVIGCDNQNCCYVWLHFSCVGIKRAPKGNWYCPKCRLLPQFKKVKVVKK